MTGSTRRTALVLLSLLALLAGALTYQQSWAAAGYRDDVRNPRTALDRLERPRGAIVTADEVIVARSDPSAAEASTYVRSYPLGERYGHITGYSTDVFGDTALEDRWNDLLTSEDDGSLRAALLEALGRDLGPGDLHLTVRDDLQQAAVDALGGQRGAVVALDPGTGAILAMVSVPGYDPNDLVGAGALEAGARLTSDPTQPLLNRASAGLYPPGSTFKLITASAGLGTDFVRPDTRLPDTDELELPGSTSTITNFGGGLCGDGETVTLLRALAISCNTAFADLGMRLGGEALVAAAEAAGWNREIPFDLATAVSRIPEAESFENDLPGLAQTALGQRDVRATPLQMALVAAAVANRGVVMLPFLVDHVTGSGGTVLRRTEPQPWRRAMDEDTAAALEEMMTAVVADGSGWRAQVPGVAVAGKTGTAEVPGAPPDVWFVAIAPAGAAPGEDRIALAVLVESGGIVGDEATGGSVAAPVAKAVLEAWFRSGNP